MGLPTPSSEPPRPARLAEFDSRFRAGYRVAVLFGTPLRSIAVAMAERNVASPAGPHPQRRLLAWVNELVDLCQPAAVHWFDGSTPSTTASASSWSTPARSSPRRRQASQLLLGLSDPTDVARVEDRTFICSADQADAGPTNNWRAPDEMRAKLDALFRGCMRGRTMYVVPFSMGPLGSPIAYIGVQFTDSPYVAVSMRTMTRMGQAVLDVLGADGDFVPCCTRSARRSRRETRRRRGRATPTTSTSRISPRRARSGRSARATAATPCWARNASRCVSHR